MPAETLERRGESRRIDALFNSGYPSSYYLKKFVYL